MTVKLIHGTYPMRGKPAVQECLSVTDAMRTVRSMYKKDFVGWFQITRNGKEVWSSDHELAKGR